MLSYKNIGSKSVKITVFSCTKNGVKIYYNLILAKNESKSPFFHVLRKGSKSIATLYHDGTLQQIFIEGATEARAPLNLSTVNVYYEIISQHTDPLK